MDLDRFAAYNRLTEEMIEFMLERLTEDEVLAGGMRLSRLWRAGVNVGPVRRAINDYRRDVHRVAGSSNGLERHFWMCAARYNAFSLRKWVGVYKDRTGFNPAWLRAPRTR